MSETNNSQVLAEIAQPALDSATQAIFEDMTRAGILYGRKKSKTNPRMAEFLFAVRNGIALFDLNKTLSAIDAARGFLKEIFAKGGNVVIVGTQPVIRDYMRDFAQRLSLPFVVERWLGGSLTNFQTISKRIKHFSRLKADRAAGRLDKYTKKERLQFDREISRLEKIVGGIETMEKLPEAILVVDANVHETAVREAKRLKIPIVALAHSDNNPDTVNYAIPANTTSKSSVEWIMAKLAEAVEEGRKERVANAAAPETEKK